MENVFTWYPTPIDFGTAFIALLFIAMLGTLFWVTRKQKPEESYES